MGRRKGAKSDAGCRTEKCGVLRVIGKPNDIVENQATHKGVVLGLYGGERERKEKKKEKREGRGGGERE